MGGLKRVDISHMYNEYIYEYLCIQRCVKYPLVNVYITMDNHHAINGKIHYFYGNFQ